MTLVLVDGRQGGIVSIYKDYIDTSLIDSGSKGETHYSYENLDCLIKLGISKLLQSVIDRPRHLQ